jgi:TolB-like protein
MKVATSDQVFRFGAFTLDLDRGTLTRADQSLFLRPKAYALLTHLARNTGRVVPKAELMDTVWPGVFVTEDSLTQSIHEIRKAMGDALVRTVSKRGYMLAVESEPAPEAGAQPIVAVLRFRNESGVAADEPVVDGFAEDIINGLARFGTITVLARNSTFSFASYARSEWPQIRSRIGADYLVEGSVHRLDEVVIVAVSLIDAATATQLWGDRYQADAEGLFLMQDDIVDEIVGRIATRVEMAGLQRAVRKPPAELSAWELAQRGVALLRDPAQSDLATAESLCREAISKDPSYGLGWTYLAVSLALGWEFGGVSEAVLAEARGLADKGAALSPDQAACRRVQSLVRLYLREHDAAEHHLKLALELNPNDAECVSQMGFLAVMRGRPLDGLAWSDRAIRLNPLDPHWCQYDRSLALYQLGEYGDAAKALLLATRPAPWVRTRLAACYAQLGQIDEARRQALLIGQEDPGFSPLDYVRRGIPFESAADTDHLAEGVLIALGEKAAPPAS